MTPLRLPASRWTLPDTWEEDRRHYVAPDSWIDLQHYAKVVAARTLRPFAPITEDR